MLENNRCLVFDRIRSLNAPYCAKFRIGFPNQEVAFSYRFTIITTVKNCVYVSHPMLTYSFCLNHIAVRAQQRPLITDDIDIVPAGSVEIGQAFDFLQNVKFRFGFKRGHDPHRGHKDPSGICQTTSRSRSRALFKFSCVNSSLGRPPFL